MFSEYGRALFALAYDASFRLREAVTAPVYGRSMALSAVLGSLNGVADADTLRRNGTNLMRN